MTLKEYRRAKRQNVLIWCARNRNSIQQRKQTHLHEGTNREQHVSRQNPTGPKAPNRFARKLAKFKYQFNIQ